MKRKLIISPIAQVREERAPTPDFIVVMRKTRQNILDALANPETREYVKANAKIAMRALNILNAFVRGRHLGSVECGDLNHGEFKKALVDSFDFMRHHAENVHNKNYDRWVMHSLEELGFGHLVIDRKAIQGKVIV